MHSCTCTIRNATNGNWDDKMFLSSHKWLLYGVNKRKCQKNTKIKSQSIIRPKCLANFVHIWRVWWCFSNVFTFTTFHCSCILIHFPSALPALFPVFYILWILMLAKMLCIFMVQLRIFTQYFNWPICLKKTWSFFV